MFGIDEHFIGWVRSKIQIMKKNRKVIGSVQRALDILNLFEAGSAALGTTEMARAMNMPKSTVAGLVSTLETNGYLVQEPENRKYRLGYRLVERAGLLLRQFDLREVAAPYLHDLRDSCDESVNLAVRDGAYVVYIERLLGSNMLSMRSEVGKREWVHSTALGKAILAGLPVDELEPYLAQYDFTAVTPRTVIDPQEFRQLLQATRARGYAIDDEENELGGRCVAAAIFDHLRRPVAAVSISVPVQRLPQDAIPALGAEVQATAREISRQLGASLD